MHVCALNTFCASDIRQCLVRANLKMGHKYLDAFGFPAICLINKICAKNTASFKPHVQHVVVTDIALCRFVQTTMIYHTNKK